MSYLTELNAFHRWLETNHLPVTSQLLWFKMIDLCNRCGWAEWISVDNCRLRMMTGGGSEKSAIKARDDLVNSGLLEYKKGHKGVPNKYKLLSFDCKLYSTNDSINDSIKGSISGSIKGSQNAVKTTVEPSAINRQRQRLDKDNIKKENTKEKVSDVEKMICELFEDEKLRQTLRDFIAMRKSIRAPMTDHAVKLLVNKLSRMSNSKDEQIDILEQSIMNSWKSIFELQTDFGNQGGNSNVSRNSQETSSNQANKYPDELFADSII